jgi:excisionase family DNA binding protein
MSDPLLIPIKEASTLIGKCRRGVYQLIATEQIKAVKSGRSTLVVYQSLKQYVDSLPTARIKAYVARNDAQKTAAIAG